MTRPSPTISSSRHPNTKYDHWNRPQGLVHRMATNNYSENLIKTYRKGTSTVVGDHFEIWIAQLHLASHLTAINNMNIIISGHGQQVLKQFYQRPLWDFILFRSQAKRQARSLGSSISQWQRQFSVWYEFFKFHEIDIWSWFEIRSCSHKNEPACWNVLKQ